MGHSEKTQGKNALLQDLSKIDLEYEVEEISSFIPGIVNIIVTMNEND